MIHKLGKGGGAVNRLLALTAAFALILTSCAPEPSRQGPGGRVTVTGGAPFDEVSARTHLLFLVDSADDPVLRQAAELFTVKLDELTSGVITAQVSLSVNPAADFAAGKAQLIYTDGGGKGSFSPLFQFLAEPVRYRNYYNYTMTANSGMVLEMLGDSLTKDVVLLAAFYQGANQLVSNIAPTGGHLLGSPMDAEFVPDGPDSPAEFDIPDATDETIESSPSEEFSAAVIPNTGMQWMLEEYGMAVSAERGLDTRLAVLAGGEAAVAEFTPAELETADLNEGMYYLGTNHGITPLWLAMDGSVELPSSYRAAITEACAYMFPVIDGHFLEQEERILTKLREQGVATDRRFDALQTVADIRDVEAIRADHNKQYLFNAIAGIS